MREKNEYLYTKMNHKYIHSDLTSIYRTKTKLLKCIIIVLIIIINFLLTKLSIKNIIFQNKNFIFENYLIQNCENNGYIYINNFKKYIQKNNYTNIFSDIINYYINLKTENQLTTKRKIYINYMDFWDGFRYKNFHFHKILEERYEVIISDKPDYIIFDQFGRDNYGIENQFDCIKIYYNVENKVPSFDNNDYMIGMHYMIYGDRYFRKPTITKQLSEIYSIYNITHINGIDIKKKKFCAWVVSNGNAKVRNNFFTELSKYKKVDSGGKFRNNLGVIVKDKSKFLSNYKFCICFENSKADGYITEKIFDCFLAGAIPLYYGDDTILNLLNNKSYIHIRNEDEFKEKIELIKKIDKNDILYEKMIKEKIVLNDKIYYKEEQKYKQFIYHIIEQDKQKAKRFERKKI